MTFLRRHWPDLVITLLILALLAGFGAVLFGGRSATDAATPVTPPTTATSPTTDEQAPTDEAAAAPDSDATLPAVPTAPDTATSDTPTATTEAPPIATPSDDTASTTDTPPASPSESTEAATPEQTAPELPTIPAQGAEDAAPSDADAASAEQDQPAEPLAAPPTAAEPEPEAPTAPAARGSAVPTSRAGTPLRSEYRLMAGVFSDASTAAERTKAIADLGYTVHFIPVANGVVAQIGPFADGSTASQAASDVRRVYSNVAVYAPVPGATPPPTAESNTARPSAESPAPAAAPASPAVPAASAAPSGPTYLQVGAFDRQENATPLVDRLRDLGFTPTVNAPPGERARVLVGPFTGPDLLSAESRLRDSGVESFRVR